MSNSGIDSLGGWIKLHRSLLKWEWWDDKNTMRLFIYCLLKANHEDVKWHGKVIQRGSFITGRMVLSKEVGISQQQTRTSLTKLENTGEITIKSTNKFTIITICNYDKYQSTEEANQPTNQPTNNQQITNKQPTNNQQITTNKNDKNNKNDKKEKNIISSPSGDVSVLPTDNAPELDFGDDELNIDYDRLIAYWNEKTKCAFGKLVSIQNNRRKMVRARIAAFGKEKFVEAIDKVCESEFLRGWGGFNFDWLIRPNNFDKVISGNYDNKNTQNKPTHGTTGTTRPPQAEYTPTTGEGYTTIEIPSEIKDLNPFD